MWYHQPHRGRASPGSAGCEEETGAVLWEQQQVHPPHSHSTRDCGQKLQVEHLVRLLNSSHLICLSLQKIIPATGVWKRFCWFSDIARDLPPSRPWTWVADQGLVSHSVLGSRFLPGPWAEGGSGGLHGPEEEGDSVSHPERRGSSPGTIYAGEWVDWRLTDQLKPPSMLQPSPSRSEKSLSSSSSSQNIKPPAPAVTGSRHKQDSQGSFVSLGRLTEGQLKKLRRDVEITERHLEVFSELLSEVVPGQVVPPPPPLWAQIIKVFSGTPWGRLPADRGGQDQPGDAGEDHGAVKHPSGQADHRPAPRDQRQNQQRDVEIREISQQMQETWSRKGSWGSLTVNTPQFYHPSHQAFSPDEVLLQLPPSSCTTSRPVSMSSTQSVKTGKEEDFQVNIILQHFSLTFQFKITNLFEVEAFIWWRRFFRYRLWGQRRGVERCQDLYPLCTFCWHPALLIHDL